MAYKSSREEGIDWVKCGLIFAFRILNVSKEFPPKLPIFHHCHIIKGISTAIPTHETHSNVVYRNIFLNSETETRRGGKILPYYSQEHAKKSHIYRDTENVPRKGNISPNSNWIQATPFVIIIASSIVSYFSCSRLAFFSYIHAILSRSP